MLTANPILFPTQTVGPSSSSSSAPVVDTAVALDEIKREFGSWFCAYIRPEKLASFPELTVMTLDTDLTGISCSIQPNHLLGNTVVRLRMKGAEGFNDRVGIAINCSEIIESVRERQFVELIFQESNAPLDCNSDDHLSNYIVSTANIATDGTLLPSQLITSKRLGDADLQHVRDILNGWVINSTKENIMIDNVRPDICEPHTKVLMTYGKTFCDRIGLDVITKIPDVPLDVLGISSCSNCEPPIDLTVLQGRPIVRFSGHFAGLPYGAAGFAFRSIHKRTDETTTECCVDVIFVRHGSSEVLYLSGLRHRDHLDDGAYSSSSTTTTDGSSSSMIKLDKVQALLTDEKITIRGIDGKDEEIHVWAPPTSTSSSTPASPSVRSYRALPRIQAIIDEGSPSLIRRGTPPRGRSS